MQLKNRLFLLGAAGVVLGSLVQACATETSSGDDDVVEDAGVVDSGTKKDATADTGVADTGTVKDTGADVTIVADTGTDTGTTVDAGRDTGVDAGPADAGPNKPGDLFDPTAPKEGDPCPAGVPENGVMSRGCGYCGTQKSFCTNGKVGVYAACVGENTNPVNRCLPNAARGSSCGICGTQVDDCDPVKCTWSPGVCENELANGCPAGEVNYIEGVCANPDEVRKQTCSAACTLGVPEPCGPEPIDTVDIPADASTLSTTFKFAAAAKNSKRASTGATSCPTTTPSSAYPAHFAKIHNPTNAPITIDVWGSKAPAPGIAVDTIMYGYARSTVPKLDADLKACTGAGNDTCSTAPCGADSDWAGLIGVLTVPANGDVVVHTSQYTVGTLDPSSAGLPFVLNVRRAPPPPAAGAPSFDIPAVGASTRFLYSLNTSSPRMSATCPAASTNTATVGTYITLTNPTAAARTVSVWEGATYGANALVDTVMASYATVPADDAARKACVTGVVDTCLTAPCESDSGLVGANAVVVPANGSAVVYVAAFYGTTVAGSKVLVNFRTEQ
jgi:hypothetical protein